jgi:hypothetical protein
MNKQKTAFVFIINKAQFFIGLAALCLGTLVYLTLRSPEQIYFTNYFGIHDRLFEIRSPILHMFGNSSPAFLHVFSFILITASFFTYSRKIYTAICAGWLVFDCAFELGQKYKIQASRMLFDFFDQIPFLENTKSYFLLGTFDLFDMIAFFFGTVMAFGVLMVTAKGKKGNGIL